MFQVADLQTHLVSSRALTFQRRSDQNLKQEQLNDLWDQLDKEELTIAAFLEKCGQLNI